MAVKLNVNAFHVPCMDCVSIFFVMTNASKNGCETNTGT